jgi:hypothetical protein
MVVITPPLAGRLHTTPLSSTQQTPPRRQRRGTRAAQRPFPPPCTAEETDACFIVRDHGGQALAYVYFEEEPGRRSASKLPTRDEARRIAANIAKLPVVDERETASCRDPRRFAIVGIIAAGFGTIDRAALGDHRRAAERAAHLAWLWRDAYFRKYG